MGSDAQGRFEELQVFVEGAEKFAYSPSDADRLFHSVWRPKLAACEKSSWNQRSARGEAGQAEWVRIHGTVTKRGMRGEGEGRGHERRCQERTAKYREGRLTVSRGVICILFRWEFLAS